MSEGVRTVAIVFPRNFADVPDTFDNGLTMTSRAACEACSVASRTSIGPETDASAWAYCPTRELRL